ncbi:MAG: CAP domain-containing protein [Bacillota bacterium]
MKRAVSIKIAIITLAVFLVTLAVPMTGALAEGAVYGKVGTYSYTVKNIENMLSALGYNVGTIDYRYDVYTEAAVKAFQKDKGLPVTGVVDTPTYKAISVAYANRGTTPAPAPAPTPASTPTPTPTPTPAPTPAPTGLTAEETQLLSLINQERTSRGLKPFEVDMRLVGTARAKAQDMAVNNYFSHTSPTLGTPYDQMVKAGITGYYILGAENIAFARSVQEAHTNFMNSDGHRRNILDPRHTHIGLGVVNGSAWGKVVVEHFAGK